MNISKKELEKLSSEGLITNQQVDQILLYYQRNNNGNKIWKKLFAISGLLISLGIILIIGANWYAIPYFIKLFVNFALFTTIVYADYYFIVNEKNKFVEIFLMLSFFMVAGTIGLIAQIYNLDGGWLSFARYWMILSIPFVFLSKTKIINILWLLLLFNSLPDVFYTYLKNIYDFFIVTFLPFSKKINFSIFLGLVYIVLELINYFSLWLYKKCNKNFLLPQAFSIIVHWVIIIVAIMLAVIYKNVVSITFTILLLSYKIYCSYKIKNIVLLRNATIFAELYIIYLFVSAYRNLFFTGIGFIIGGILLLLSVYGLRKTLQYVNKLEAFK